MQSFKSKLFLILRFIVMGIISMPNAKAATISSNDKVANWLNSGEFVTDMDNALTNIVKGAKQSSSESATANVFEREIYYLIRTRTGINLTIDKETPVNGVVHNFGHLAERKSGRGRLDAVVNSLVIEYKHNTKLSSVTDREEAIQQVKDYLVALKNKDNTEYSAILTDGIRISYFSFVDGSVKETKMRTMSRDDVEKIIRAILNNRTKKFDPKNIANDFAVSGLYTSDTRSLAIEFYKVLSDSSTAKTDMLYEEWKNLMHFSVDDNGKSQDVDKRRRDLSGIFKINIKTAEDEYRALFALQTTYALVVKLIACKVLDNLNFNSDAKQYHDLIGLDSNKIQHYLQNMEDGYSYSNMGMRNFLEGDYFSWYADEHQWEDAFYPHVSQLIYQIDDYSAFSFNVKYDPVDVFKDLYMSIIPQSVRHSMGEYFTPEWLADCVISRSLSLLPPCTHWRAIDPCCGSGIFVVELIKKVVGDVVIADMSKDDRARLVSDVLDRVHGVDINPLAVLSARVSYYLALHKIGEVSDVEIPIYLGDSAIIPTRRIVNGIPCYYYRVNNLKGRDLEIVLPERLVDRKDFGKMMSKLQALVKAEDASVLLAVFEEYLEPQEQGSIELRAKLEKLSEDLVELHKNRWDGIWIRISMNFMMIARLRNFNLIVGNPPWVKWEHLPAAYTRKIKEFCDVRHIFCNDGGMYGGAQLNLCALIANVVASNWLTRDGVLAFLMPDSIMSQNSYEEFRNFYLDYAKGDRLYLQCLDRWMPPLRPFKVGKKSVTQDFNTYYYCSNHVDYAIGVPVRAIGKKKRVSDETINGYREFSAVSNLLDFSSCMAKQLSRQSTAFTYCTEKSEFNDIIGESDYLYRTGVESTPFEVFKMLGVGPSKLEGHYRFRNKILKTSKYKVDDIPLGGWDLPTEYIYPMLEGPSVKPFTYDCGDNYHIVPYKKENTKSPVPLSEMYASDEELAVYFTNHRDLLDRQSEKSKAMHRGGDFYALSKIGPYTFAPFMVAARDNSYFCSAVVSPTVTAWGETKQTICVKHTIIISQDKKGNFISEDEAHYINGILNSSIVHEYIHSTFKTNGFSLNKSKLYIPKYDAEDGRCTKIVCLSREATECPKKGDDVSRKLTTVYLDLCRNRK